LSSISGALDSEMDNPANPGTDIPAAFSGELDTLLPGGPSDFRILDFEEGMAQIQLPLQLPWEILTAIHFLAML